MATAVAKGGAAEAPQRKSMLLLVIVLSVVLLAGGGAGAWYFLKAGAGADEDDAVSRKPPLFLPLDPFTVNLQPDDGQQFLQVALTLRVSDAGAVEAIKQHLPEVRSRVLLLLASKKPSHLLTSDGKAKLAAELAREIEAPITPERPARKRPARSGAKEATRGGKAAREPAEEEEDDAPKRVLAVLFTHFIIQ